MHCLTFTLFCFKCVPWENETSIQLMCNTGELSIISSAETDHISEKDHVSKGWGTKQHFKSLGICICLSYSYLLVLFFFSCVDTAKRKLGKADSTNVHAMGPEDSELPVNTSAGLPVWTRWLGQRKTPSSRQLKSFKNLYPLLNNWGTSKNFNLQSFKEAF